ncbi:LEA type 2 family protein [bacterium]|nr:LEA type 2 family protein [bacterium]
MPARDSIQQRPLNCPKRILLLCLIMLALACGPEVIQPTVDILDIEEWELGLATSPVIVSVELDNPNAFGGTLVGADYQLEFNGVRVGSGELDAEYNITPAGVTLVFFPLELDHALLIESLLGETLDELSYSIQGTAYLRTIVGDFEEPFEKTGRTSIPLMIESLFD